MGKKREVAERFFEGRKIACPICGHTLFWSRATLMNTAGLTFFDLDWANRSATNYICDRCGHILWFFGKK